MRSKLTPIHYIYLRDHPLALWFSVGAIITGVPILIAPFLANGSAALSILPPWAVFVWAAWYALGGSLSLWGMVRLSPRLEAAGMAFLASALAVTIVTAFVARGVGALLSGAFLVTLVIGCASRAYFLGWTQ
jgi:hypothetical protein